MKILPIPLLALALTGPAQAQTSGGPLGLKGEYFAGKNFERLVTTRTDKAINFTWTHKIGARKQGRKVWSSDEEREWIAPADGVPMEMFSVRWTGQLVAPESGTYIFEVSADDGVRVWVGGIPVINAWHLQQETRYTNEVELKAGSSYSIKVEYYQERLDAVMKLSWRKPSEPDDAPTHPIEQTAFHYSKPKPLAPKPIAEEEEVAEAKPAAAPPPAAAPMKTVAVVDKAPATQAAAKKPAPAKAAAQPMRLERGKTITLPSLFFELNTPELLPSSEPTLDGLVAAMRAQPDLRIAIEGHTDLAQDKARSRVLSLERANVVRDYLTESGIDSGRITTEGYGCSKPLVQVSDARNRRVEVRVH